MSNESTRFSVRLSPDYKLQLQRILESTTARTSAEVLRWALRALKSCWAMKTRADRLEVHHIGDGRLEALFVLGPYVEQTAPSSICRRYDYTLQIRLSPEDKAILSWLRENGVGSSDSGVIRLAIAVLAELHTYAAHGLGVFARCAEKLLPVDMPMLEDTTGAVTLGPSTPSPGREAVADEHKEEDTSDLEKRLEKWWKSYLDKRDEESRNRLLEHYLPIVKRSAERLRVRLPDEVDVDDLISAGVFGLMDALKAYDPMREVKFETYCALRVRGAILDELRAMDWVPRLVRSRASNFNNATVACEAETAESLLAQLVSLCEPFARHGKPHIEGREETASVIEEFCTEYLSAWRKVTGRSIRKDYSHTWIAEQVFTADFDEIEQRMGTPAFYRSHVAALNLVAGELCERLRTWDDDQEGARQAVTAASALMSDLASRAIVLLQDYCLRSGKSIQKSVFANTITHHRVLYGVAISLWRGDFLQDIWSTGLIIRQAIEIRIRHAVNVFGLSVDGEDRPLALSNILAVLKKESHAESEVPWHVIERIYRWANLHVHTGFQDYPWLGGFALAMLKPLMCGIREESGGWSVDNAIRISSAGLERVCQTILSDAKEKFGTEDIKILSAAIHPRCKVVACDTVQGANKGGSANPGDASNT